MTWGELVGYLSITGVVLAAVIRTLSGYLDWW